MWIWIEFSFEWHSENILQMTYTYLHNKTQIKIEIYCNKRLWSKENLIDLYCMWYIPLNQLVDSSE